MFELFDFDFGIPFEVAEDDACIAFAVFFNALVNALLHGGVVPLIFILVGKLGRHLNGRQGQQRSNDNLFHLEKSTRQQFGRIVG